jgi:hypothetical protein
MGALPARQVRGFFSSDNARKKEGFFPSPGLVGYWAG